MNGELVPRMEGLILDPQGFVATCDSTHFFVVRRLTESYHARIGREPKLS